MTTYEEDIAARIRAVLGPQDDFTERKMFGGVAFLHNGHMCCGIAKKNLVVRVGPKQYEATLSERHVRPMDFTGRPLRGMVYVDPAGFHTNKALKRWISKGIAFTATLVPKKGSA